MYPNRFISKRPDVFFPSSMATSHFHCVYCILYIIGMGLQVYISEICPKYELSDSAVGSQILSTVTGVQNLIYQK